MQAGGFGRRQAPDSSGLLFEHPRSRDVTAVLDQKTASPQRLLELLEALLRLSAGDLKATLDHVTNLVAEATGADKIDVFLYDAARDSLVAIGTSTQPLSALQKQHGLDVLQLSNG